MTYALALADGVDGTPQAVEGPLAIIRMVLRLEPRMICPCRSIASWALKSAEQLFAWQRR